MKRGRPKKVRYIQKMPKVVQFSPRGKPGRPDEAFLSFDEFEAIRLADLQAQNHVAGARAMGVSRPSFSRILKRARQILADALINGKIIKISLGDAQVGVRPLEVAQFSPKMRRVIEGVLVEKQPPEIRRKVSKPTQRTIKNKAVAA